MELSNWIILTLSCYDEDAGGRGHRLPGVCPIEAAEKSYVGYDSIDREFYLDCMGGE